MLASQVDKRSINARTFTLEEMRGGAAAARRRSVKEDGCLGALTIIIEVLHNLFEANIDLFRYPTTGRRAKCKFDMPHTLINHFTTVTPSLLIACLETAVNKCSQLDLILLEEVR